MTLLLFIRVFTDGSRHAGARAETVRALARAVCDGRISFESVTDSEALLNRLCEIPGIGKWTAQYVAMRALGERH
jgi:AraC family transcriptional regulator of adaptative response / DNA-3-methyladenine glycosylase II